MNFRFYWPLPVSVTFCTVIASRLSAFTVSAFISLTLDATILSLFLSFHNVSSADPFLLFGMHLFLNRFTVTCGEMFCHTVMLHWQRRVTQGFWILPAGIKVWSSPKIHSLYSGNCLRWSLSGLFTTLSNTSSSEVILLGMTKTSVFVELSVIASFIAGVKCL